MLYHLLKGDRAFFLKKKEEENDQNTSLFSMLDLT